MNNTTRLRRLGVTCTTIAALLLAPAAAAAAPGPDAHADRTVGRAAGAPMVLVVSLDGFNPSALGRLGAARTPNLHRLMREGAYTLEARSQVELTATLPNHTSMVTGRRINAAAGGHGVTWNTERPGSTVQKAAGHPVSSVFSRVHSSGRSTALFATKTKFRTFRRSWPGSIDRFGVVEDRDPKLVTRAKDDLAGHHRAFTFLHLGMLDETGHKHGFMGREYLDAVQRMDRQIGRLLSTIDGTAHLRQRLTVLVTADHGGRGPGHYDPDRRANYRVPFIAWGAAAGHGDLYALNPGYTDPGSRQPPLRNPSGSPIRNADVANLALDVLGMRPISGSLFDAAQGLRID